MSFKVIVGLGVGLTCAAASVAAATALVQEDRSPPIRVGYGLWSPGAAGSVRALRELPVVANPSPALARAVVRAASATGGDPNEALRTLRKLRSDLGRGGFDLYAFNPGQRATCLVVWQSASTCPTNPRVDHPGVLFLVTGGSSSTGDPANVDVPSAVSGIVADNVRQVELVHGGVTAVVPVENNTFFTEIPNPSSNMELRITYSGGVEKTLRLPDPRP